MTRRPRTRAAAKAKPAPTTAKTTKTKAQAAPKRGTKAASATPAADDKVKRPSPSKGVKASTARKPTTKAAAAKATATKAPPKKAAKTAADKRGATPSAASRTASSKTASSKTAPSRAATGTPKRTRPETNARAEPAKTPLRSATKTKRADAATPRTTKPPKAATRRKAPREPAYLAAELGQPVDREGEPIGAGSAMLNGDAALQDYSLRLWRQMQSGGVVNRYMRAIERAGLTVDEVWTAGVIETRSTSSTADEMRRYKQKLLFRANLLEAILSETVADLHRLEGIEPADAPTPPQDAVGEPT